MERGDARMKLIHFSVYRVFKPGQNFNERVRKPVIRSIIVANFILNISCILFATLNCNYHIHIVYPYITYEYIIFTIIIRWISAL